MSKVESQSLDIKWDPETQDPQTGDSLVTGTDELGNHVQGKWINQGYAYIRLPTKNGNPRNGRPEHRGLIEILGHRLRSMLTRNGQ